MNHEYFMAKIVQLYEQLAKNLINTQPLPWNTPNAEFYSKVLKNRPTSSELILKDLLSPEDFEFQQPVMCYVSDFGNSTYRLIVEIDGEYHMEDEKWFARDKEREQYLLNYGFQIIRFTNKEVEEYPKEVKAIIESCLVFVRNFKNLPISPGQALKQEKAAISDDLLKH